MSNFSTHAEALKWIFKNCPYNKLHDLSLTQSNTELVYFIKSLSNGGDIDTTNVAVMNLFSAIIPSLYSLLRFIESKNSIWNITDVIDKRDILEYTRLGNVPDFYISNKNFVDADAFIKFVLGEDMIIAVKFIHKDIEWVAPHNDIVNLNFNVPKSLIPSRLSDIKESELGEIFNYIYGFNPYTAKNNGLFLVALKVNDTNMSMNTPVYPIKTIESELADKGICKKYAPALSIKKIDDNNFILFNNLYKLCDFTVS